MDAPYPLPEGRTGLLEVHDEIDPPPDRFVDDEGSVGGKDDETFVLFKLYQKIMDTIREQRFGFVEKQDRIVYPGLSEQYRKYSFIVRSGKLGDVVQVELEDSFIHRVGHRMGAHCLSGARWSYEQHDQSVPVFCYLGELDLLLLLEIPGKRLDPLEYPLFLFLRKDHLVEGDAGAVEESSVDVVLIIAVQNNSPS
jgi:hypothetical protein